MTPTTKDTVLAALRAVRDAASGKDVVAAGMISGVVVRDGNVGFAVEVDPAAAQAMEPVRRACEDAVRALPGVRSVTAVLTAERPPAAATPPPQQRQGRHHAAGGAAARPGLPGVRAIIAVGSGKGGVGKSTTAVNLAVALVQLGQRVGLLDADIYGPSVPRLTGVSGRPETVDGKRVVPPENYGLKIMSMGFLVDEDAPMIWRGPMVQSAIQQMLNDVAWGELDALIVDLPPGTGDAQLTLAQKVPLTGAVVVSTPQDLALMEARKAINMFRRVDVPVLGVVENMSYFACPHCGGRSEIFSHGGARETARRMGVDLLGEIPLDIAIRESTDAGRPPAATLSGQPQSDAYLAMAQAVADKVERLLGGERKPFPAIEYVD